MKRGIGTLFLPLSSAGRDMMLVIIFCLVSSTNGFTRGRF